MRNETKLVVVFFCIVTILNASFFFYYYTENFNESEQLCKANPYTYGAQYFEEIGSNLSCLCSFLHEDNHYVFTYNSTEVSRPKSPLASSRVDLRFDPQNIGNITILNQTL